MKERRQVPVAKLTHQRPMVESGMEHEAEELGIPPAVVHDQRHEPSQHLAIVAGRFGGLELGHPLFRAGLAGLFFEDRFIEVFLVREVLENKRLGHIGGLRDFPSRGAGKSSFCEQSRGGEHQLLSAVGGRQAPNAPTMFGSWTAGAPDLR